MSILLALVLQAAVSSAPAAIVAAPVAPAPPPPVSGDAKPAKSVVRPTWVRRPTAAELEKVFPPAAAKAHVSGRAVIECQVALDGTARACRVVQETPADQGFGAAALALAPTLRLTPALVDGQPVDGAVVRIPVNFDAAPAQTASNTYDLLAMLNLEEVERCSGYAAAAAEVDPASLNAQIRLFYFRTGLMQKMAQARMKPSEFETRIVAARQRATERMAKGEGVAEQAACEAEGPPLPSPAAAGVSGAAPTTGAFALPRLAPPQ